MLQYFPEGEYKFTQKAWKEDDTRWFKISNLKMFDQF